MCTAAHEVITIGSQLLVLGFLEPKPSASGVTYSSRSMRSVHAATADVMHRLESFDLELIQTIQISSDLK